MKKLNILSKTDGWSSGHTPVTLGTTVGSPSVHRRGTLLKLLSMLVLMVFGFGQMWATSPATLSFSAKCDGSGTDSDGNSWTITSDGNESNFDSDKGIHYGTNNAYVQYVQLSTSGISGTITQVVVNAYDAQSKATASVTVGGTAYTCSGSASVTNTSANFTFTGSSTGEIVVKVDRGSSMKKAIYVKSVVVTYTTGSTVAVTSVTLDESAITLDEEATQTLTATVLPENATNKNVTWESNSEDVATVVNGVVTAKGAGDATIKCKSVADETKYAECAVHVNPSPYSKSNLIFDAACGGTGTADDDAEWTVTSDGAESVYDATSGIHYGTGSANVTYLQLATSEIEGSVVKVVVNARDAQATATISVTVGGTAFTCSESTTATNTSTDYTFTGTGSGEIVVRVDRGSSMAKAIYVKSVKVSYIPSASVKKPSFSVEGGSYLGAQEVEITCATAGANIFYTLDGNDPTSGSIPYNGAISITETKTLKAIAIKDEVSSPIASATYTIIKTAHAGTAEDPYSVADAKIVIDGIGTKEDAYVSGKISQVDEYLSSYKSITYWISADGTTSGQQLKVYSGKGIGGADFSSVDDVAVKATVVVKGALKLHNNSVYEFDYNNQLVSYEAPAEPIVTLSPLSLNLEAEGNGTQEITLTATNFENEVNEITCAFYNTAACDGEAISQPAWITNLTDNNSNQVSFDVADNDGDARQVWLKVTASDGTDEAFAVLPISQAKYVPDYAELPFAFDGGRADIATTNGMSQVGLDSDYGSSPKLKFNSTDDVVIIKINANPGTLSYNIKGNGFSEGTFKVQESKDGNSYTDVATYTSFGTNGNDAYSESGDKAKNLDKDTRFVKFIYTEKVSGNVALGNIAISEYVAPAVKPTITTQPVGAEYTQNDTPDDLTIAAEAAKGGALSYQWYSNSSNSTEGATAIVGANSSSYKPSTENTGTVYYYCVVTEAGADEPTTSDIVAIEVKAAPVATGTYELFEGALEEGDYVIVVNEVAMTNNNSVSSDRLDNTDVTIEDDAITNPDASIVWHIAASGDYWTIFNAAVEKFAASTGGKNKAQMLADGTDDKAKWTVSKSENAFHFRNKANADASVNANLQRNGEYGWACYQDYSDITLYKEAAPAAPFAVTLATCENGSVGATAAEAITSGDEVLSGTTITLSNTPAPGCQFVAYEVYKTEDPTKKVTVKENADVYTFKMPAYAVTISATFSVIPVLDDIALSGEYQTTFWQGVPFSSNGLTVTASYTNADPAEVTPTSITEPDMSTPGVKAITVTYTEGEVTKEKSYHITVKAVPSTQDNPYTVAEARSLYDAYYAASIAQPTVFVKGVVTSASMEKGSNAPDAYKNKAYNVYVKDAETDGSVTFEFYRMLDGREVETPVAFTEGDITEGDTLIAVGTLSKYNSIYEFSAGCSLEVRKEFKAEKVDISNTPETAYTPAKAIELYNDPTSDLTKEVYVKGVVTGNPSFVSGKTDDEEKWNGTYNVYVRAIGDESQNPTKFEFYRMYSDGSEGKFEDGDIVTLDTIIAKGILSKYSSTYEFAQGCVMIEHKAYQAPVVAVESVELDETATVKVGKTVQLTATVLPAEATNKNVTWSVKAGGEAYAEVSATGLVTGKEEGTAIIIVTTEEGNFSAECTVTVEEAPAMIKFNKVTSTADITNGEYLIVYEDGKLAFNGGRETLDATQNTIAVEIENDVIELEDANAVFTIDTSAGSIRAASGKYIGQTSDANGLVENETALENALTIDEDGNFVAISGGAYMRYNATSGQERFRYFKSSTYTNQKAIQLYKKEDVWIEGVRTSLTAGWYYTMCLEKAVTNVRGASIWRVLSKAENGSDVILEEVPGILDAGRPYFLYATAENLDVVYTGAAVNGPVNDDDNNGLIGSFTQTKIAQSPDNYILYNNALYFVNSDNVYVGANRAYLNMEGVPDYHPEQHQGNAPRRRVTMTVNSEQNATGFDELNASEAPTKKVINGQLFILRGEKIYDATGRLVK